jgi:hypothetical protein
MGRTKVITKSGPFPNEFRMMAAAINDPATRVVTYSKTQNGMKRDFRSFIIFAEQCNRLAS